MSGSFKVSVDFPPDDRAISELHCSAFDEPGTGAEPWAERLTRHSVTWAGVFVDRALVAFAHVVWDGGAHGFLLDTAVHPHHRHRGYGRAVVLAAAAAAHSAGCVWLHVDYEPSLESFYADACGFDVTSAGLMRLG